MAALDKLFEVSVAEDQSYIRLTVLTSVITFPIAMESTLALKEINDELGIYRFLLDLRQARSVTSVNEKYEFAYEKLKMIIQEPSTVRAALLKAENDNSFSFLETVMRNASYKFRVFDAEDDALEWLIR